MRCLITGASGFIGSALAHHLLAIGWDVSVLLRNPTPIRNPRLNDIWDKLEFQVADITDAIAMQEKGDFLVFHLAAYNHVGNSWSHVEECARTNILGTLNALQCLKWSRFIYTSSSEVYGHQTRWPWSENMAPAPNSPYAVSKYTAELYCQVRQRMEERVVILRPFNAYGPGQATGAIIPELITKMLKGEEVHVTKGEQTREFVYVGDHVEGFVRAAEVLEIPEGPINLCTGKDISIKELVETLATLTKTKSKVCFDLPYRNNEIFKMVGDGKKAQKTLGWKPKVGLREGLERTVEWFKRRRS